jgi:formylglycine-generating enzyme required for sulfatase activity
VIYSSRTALAALLLAVAGAGYFIHTHPAPPSAAQSERERQRTPDDFVYVPGGECWIGTDDADADEDVRPRRRAFVPSFYIGKREVSQAEWKRFHPEFKIEAGKEQYPVTAVKLEDAAAYCRFVGGRLPTDLEWEKAARGTDGRRYPWGDQFEVTRANLRGIAGSVRQPVSSIKPGTGCSVHSRLKAVDAFPESASPYGAINMAGNAWEWVADAYHGNPETRIIRGGAAGYWERDARTYNRALEGAGVT